MNVMPVVLQGRRVRLEPLESAHRAGLADAAPDPALWRWIAPLVRKRQEMMAYVESTLDEQERGVSLPFVLVEKNEGRLIGSTRYGNIDHRRRAEMTINKKLWRNRSERKELGWRPRLEIYIKALRIRLKRSVTVWDSNQPVRI